MRARHDGEHRWTHCNPITIHINRPKIHQKEKCRAGVDQNPARHYYISYICKYKRTYSKHPHLSGIELLWFLWVYGDAFFMTDCSENLGWPVPRLCIQGLASRNAKWYPAVKGPEGGSGFTHAAFIIVYIHLYKLLSMGHSSHISQVLQHNVNISNTLVLWGALAKHLCFGQRT